MEKDDIVRIRVTAVVIVMHFCVRLCLCQGRGRGGAFHKSCVFFLNHLVNFFYLFAFSFLCPPCRSPP